MAVVVLASPGGSPGVTATALALALSWPSPVVMAECDPAGGNVLAGMWQGAIPAGDAGMVPYALAAQRAPGAAADAIFSRAIPLEEIPASRFVLPGMPGPDTGRQMASAWPSVADSFAAAEPDVIADIGRFDADPALRPLLDRAARVLLVCRPTLRQAAAATPRLAAMAHVRAADGLIVVGTGPYAGRGPQVLSHQLGLQVTGHLPEDPETAGFLSDGGEPGRRFSRSPLMRAASVLAARIAREMTPGQGARAHAEEVRT